MNQNLALVRVAALADSIQPRLGTGRMLLRQQPHPGRELSSLGSIPTDRIYMSMILLESAYKILWGRSSGQFVHITRPDARLLVSKLDSLHEQPPFRKLDLGDIF